MNDFSVFVLDLQGHSMASYRATCAPRKGDEIIICGVRYMVDNVQWSVDVKKGVTHVDLWTSPS